MLPKLLLVASASRGIVGILAVSITVLVFSTLGLIPGYAWNIVALLGVMFIYIKNYNDNELFIVYSLFFISLLGFWVFQMCSACLVFLMCQRCVKDV